MDEARQILALLGRPWLNRTEVDHNASPESVVDSSRSWLLHNAPAKLQSGHIRVMPQTSQFNKLFVGLSVRSVAGRDADPQNAQKLPGCEVGIVRTNIGRCQRNYSARGHAAQRSLHSCHLVANQWSLLGWRM
jgi:hypothetical protein